MKRLGIVVVLVLIVGLFATNMVLAGPVVATMQISMSVRGSPTSLIATDAGPPAMTGTVAYDARASRLDVGSVVTPHPVARTGPITGSSVGISYANKSATRGSGMAWLTNAVEATARTTCSVADATTARSAHLADVPSIQDINALTTAKCLHARGTFKDGGNVRLNLKSGSYNFGAGYSICYDIWTGFDSEHPAKASDAFKAGTEPERELSNTERGLLCSRPTTWITPSANTGEANAGHGHASWATTAHRTDALAVSNDVVLTTF